MPDDLQEIEDRVLKQIEELKDKGELPVPSPRVKPIHPIGAW